MSTSTQEKGGKAECEVLGWLDAGQILAYSFLIPWQFYLDCRLGQWGSIRKKSETITEIEECSCKEN